jgi:uncharacterized protein YcnI
LRTTRLAVVLTGASASLLLLAGPASAHVSVDAPGATQGGFAKLAFRVPNEKAVATTKVEITFPTDAPLGFASVKPHVGWTYKVTKHKLATPIKTDDGDVTEAVSTITWTATAGGIKSGEFDDFEVSAGPLPEVDEMVFKALQTYADGSVVRWIEPTVAGGAEPDHPAPVLKLAAATTAATPSATASPTATATSTATAAPTVTAVQTAKDDTARTLGGAGLGAGAVALLVALAALVRSRRATSA